MDESSISRRGFLAGMLSFGLAGALGAVTLPNAPKLLQAARQPLPGWVYVSPTSVQAYRAALNQPELMASLPCFCGCGRFEPPHASLRECFIQPGGQLEPHASGCEVCQFEALDTKAWAAEGLSWHEVHARVVERYGERGPSTPMNAHA
jgi:uncharacterized protein with PCYCGC motif